MGDPQSRRRQHADVRDPHIAPFTELIDDLIANGIQPRLDALHRPMYGGVNARVLSIFRDPGPKTQDGSGRGMHCWENDDPSAELHATLPADALAHAEAGQRIDTPPASPRSRRAPPPSSATGPPPRQRWPAAGLCSTGCPTPPTRITIS